ncbi:phage major capsid protein [Rhizobium sp. SGZ-381]|uniref:phage major capsid protein n=1 Tax=Rhizobium sp. SGZ-381 TaxID=3342800 RepID=UPI0036713AF5
MDKLTELRQALSRAVDQLGTDEFVRDAGKYSAKEAEIADLQGQIDRLTAARSRSASLARPVSGGASDEQVAITVPTGFSLDHLASRSVRQTWSADDYIRGVRSTLNFTPDPQQHFGSFGEQLRAVANYYLTRDPGRIDPRLQRAPTGAGEVDPSAGGFLVQTDFATAVFARAYDMGQIMSRAQKLSLSTGANGIKIPGVDETSRATGSRWGGVQSYWVGEGDTATRTKPKFRLVELDLKKLMANWYVSDELMADASVMNTIATQAFSEEITFMTEDAMFRGTGAGMPLGFLNSSAKVTVAKKTGQAAKTFTYENALDMWSRMWSRSRANAVWVINQDVEPQLFSMAQVIGTAGVPVYLPANGISGLPYGTLFGRPVIPQEYADTLGTEGDVSLVDFSQYVLADKGGVNMASSMHVAFLTDEMVFRITYRVDGEPIWHSPLTPYKGTNTLSPFVTLATRG